ncbi:hypothetical protein ABZW11_45025 [Nonomuraea sp. NPDC004580]|uniref:hypothetical protein n=1 Tax=Nonomuraea sp. NPDC004580 TaxID=3154552 RepID=UPI0033AC4597
MTPDSTAAFDHISAGYDPDPALSMSLHADAYTDPRWHEIDQRDTMPASSSSTRKPPD